MQYILCKYSEFHSKPNCNGTTAKDSAGWGLSFTVWFSFLQLMNDSYIHRSYGNITIKTMFRSGRGTQKALGRAVTERCRWGWMGSEICGTVGVKALMETWWWNCPKHCPLPRSPDIDRFSWILHGHSGTKPAENKDIIRIWHN